MTKKATITVSLVPESEKENNEAIKKEILNESSIPWCNEIVKVEIEEVEIPYKELRGHGFSKKVARNIIKFYEC